MQVPSWRREGGTGSGIQQRREADFSPFNSACPAQGCQGRRSCLQPHGGKASGKDPLSCSPGRVRVWSRRGLAMPRGALSQLRAGFKLRQGEGLNVAHPTRFLLWAGGHHCLCMAAGGDEEGPPFSPSTAPSPPQCFPGCRWWRPVQPLAQPLAQPVQPLPGNGSRMQTEAGTIATVSGGVPGGLPRGSGSNERVGETPKAWRGAQNSSAVVRVSPAAIPEHHPACQGQREGFSRGPLPTPAKAFGAHSFSVGSNPDPWSRR